MTTTWNWTRGWRGVAVAGGAATLAFVAGASMSPAMAQTHQVTVTVHSIKLLDRVDAASQADLFARVTIDGEQKVTSPLKQTGRVGDTIHAEFVVSKAVKPGTVPVKLELLDKDVRSDDLIDINRLDNRRVLDFTVNTRTCRIAGFPNAYRCNSRITRAGTENKKAEVTFTVAVRK